MTHKRQQIREYAVTALTGMPSFPGVPVVGRVYPAGRATQLPAVGVTTPEETFEERVMRNGGAEQGRSLSVAVEIMATGAGYLDAIDAVALDAETALAADPTWGGLVEDAYLDSSSTEISGEMEAPVGAMVLAYQVRYRVASADPQ